MRGNFKQSVSHGTRYILANFLRRASERASSSAQAAGRILRLWRTIDFHQFKKSSRRKWEERERGVRGHVAGAGADGRW